MANRSSILVLDDGELDNFYEMLVELGTDVVRLKGPEIRQSVVAPRDLLISAGRRTLNNMPELLLPEDASRPPTWVCVHNQDFLPMRQRLSEMGVHFLLQNALDEQSRRRFLIQLLRPGVEQRRSLRLPLGSDLVYRPVAHAEATETGVIIDLSVDGCRLRTRDQFASGDPLVAFLPASLGGGEELKLTGRVLRNSELEVGGGEASFATVIQFEGLDEVARAQLESIASGEQIGTQITPLASVDATGRVAETSEASETESADEDDEVLQPIDPAEAREPSQPTEPVATAQPRDARDANRRGKRRQDYQRPVQLLDPRPADPDAVFGCDLSLGGVRLSGCRGLAPGSEVTVALFGAAREEPIVIEARVIRTSARGEAALSFGVMTPTQRDALKKLLSARPVLDALAQPDCDAGRTVIAELRDAASA